MKQSFLFTRIFIVYVSLFVSAISFAHPGGIDPSGVINKGDALIFIDEKRNNCDDITEPPTYCDPTFISACYSNINNVIVGGLSNLNTSCSSGYENYSASLSTTVAAGSVVNYDIAAGGISSNVQNLSIYVDFNNDGDFDDIGETVVNNQPLSLANNAMGIFNIPALQSPGSYRMRVASAVFTSTNPCSSDYGEIEDYTLIIPIPSLYCIPEVTNPCSDASINMVSIGNGFLGNFTGCNSYTDYSSLYTKAEPGQTLTYDVRTSNNAAQQVNIYIDYNDDGDFNDADEHVVTDAVMYPFAAALGNFTVPISQSYGTYRLRITTDYLGMVDDPCFISNGEVEDYNLVIAACLPFNADIHILPGEPYNICTGQSTTLQVTIPAAPAPAYRFTYTDGSNNYNYEAENNVGDNVAAPIYVYPSATTQYSLLNIADIFGCPGTVSGDVTINVGSFNVTPAAAIVQPTCATGAGTITISSPSGSQYGYSIGGAYQPGPVFNNVPPGSYTLTVQQNGNCISTSTSAIIINPIPGPPATPGAVSGLVNVCAYAGSATQLGYSVPHDPNATGHLWTVPPTITIVNGQGSDSITVLIGAGFTAAANKVIKVQSLSTCGNSSEKLFYLAAQLPVTPAPIVTSSSNICLNIGTNIPVTYSIPRIAAASSYIWTFSNGTITINHPFGTAEMDTTVSVIFSPGFTTGTLSVRAVNNCGSSNARSLAISKITPSTPGLINGPTNICPYLAPNGIPATYSVAAIANVASFNWIVPAGAIGLTGQGTNSISFIYPAGYTGGAISVTSINGCGSSVLPRNLSVTKLNPSTPGPIDVIQLQSCPNRRYSYTLATMPSNANSVQWTVPAAAIGFTGQGTAGIIVDYPATAVVGSITATATSNCGNSSTRNSAVRLPACPPPGFANKTSSNEFAKKDMEEPATDKTEAIIYPNPGRGDINIKIRTFEKCSFGVIQLIGINGNVIESKKVSINKEGMLITKIVSNGLATGIYQVRYTIGYRTGMLKVIIIK